ncbi:MAG TPA: hypothetical protein VG204_10755 [Terriglobia bacterium]|nr:hypothetical protein [Terriglobia bacterium]
MGKLLCWMGFHKWEKLGAGDSTGMSVVYRCKRQKCKLRKLVSQLGYTFIGT